MKLERIGNCRIDEEIASGGMAVVYKATQESLNRTVAIKALKTSVASEAQFATRFEREALSLAQLQHENIIHVYDFHRQNGAFFIVMEYVEGLDLYDLLDRCGRLPIEVSAVIAMQAARALDYAHYRGIIHRDIKPANIMVSISGGVKLMDFGIARDESFGDLTEAGAGLGTPSYMSPEQILGDKLDFRSDMFSVGILLYQMITGRKPFVEDANKSVMNKIRLEKPVSPRKLNPEVPRQLERILNRCLQKQPRDRYRSTQDLVLALERFLARRVEMNYNARLVLFLKNHGIISAEEADQFLLPLSGSNGTPATTPSSFRAAIKRAAIVQTAIAATVAFTVALLHTAPIGASATSAPAAIPYGHLQVIAEPWAHVFVDGKQVATTPFAVPVRVPAGVREVVLKNKYFKEVSKRITVPEGNAEKPAMVRVILEESE